MRLSSDLPSQNPAKTTLGAATEATNEEISKQFCRKFAQVVDPAREGWDSASESLFALLTCEVEIYLPLFDVFMEQKSFPKK